MKMFVLTYYCSICH